MVSSSVAARAAARSASSSRISSRISTSRRRRRSKFSSQQGRECASVASTQLSQLTLPRAQRRPCSDALREQQPLDPVLDAQLLLHEALALAVRSLAVLLLGCRHAHHAAHLSVAAQPGREHAQHTLSVEPVGFGSTHYVAAL